MKTAKYLNYEISHGKNQPIYLHISQYVRNIQNVNLTNRVTTKKHLPC